VEHRLTTHIVVSALRKRAEQAGGSCTIIARGDMSAGGLILICAEKGHISGLFELAYDYTGKMTWRPCLAQLTDEQQKVDKYVADRRRTDPDLWCVELDIPAAERFAADFAANA